MKRSAGALILAIVLGSTLLLGSALAMAGEQISGVAEQSAPWDQADANKDGYISREEAGAAAPSTSPVIDFMASDKDSDGRVSKDEYAAAQIQPRASDDSQSRAVMNRGAAGPAGPGSEK